MPKWDSNDQHAGEGAAARARRPRERPRHDRERAAAAEPERGAHGRRVGRHRRRVVDRADGDAALSVEHPRRTRATTGPTRSRWPRPSRTRALVAGAKVQAMTMLDLLLTPKVITDAWDYFRNVQTKDRKYTPFIGPVDQPRHLAQRRHHGEVPRGDAEVLLRSRRSTRRTSSSWGSSIRPSEGSPSRGPGTGDWVPGFPVPGPQYPGHLP